MDRYILASQSSRRRELLHLVLNDYEVIPAQGEEVVTSSDPAEAVKELSLQKAMEVAQKVRPCQGDRIVVIGADTVVAVDGKILGKPEDRADAARMIGMLQGREHHVYTGVTVCWTQDPADETENPGRGETGIRHFSFSEETAVDVFPMNRGETLTEFRERSASLSAASAGTTTMWSDSLQRVCTMRWAEEDYCRSLFIISLQKTSPLSNCALRGCFMFLINNLPGRCVFLRGSYSRELY